jgi:hypothetical protein
MESNKHHPVANDEILVEKLCEAFKDARKNGKLHVEVEEFNKNYSELEQNATLKV